jgi:hypothetical protein
MLARFERKGLLVEIGGKRCQQNTVLQNTLWTLQNSLRSCQEHHAAATHHEVQITTKRKTIPKKRERMVMPPSNMGKKVTKNLTSDATVIRAPGASHDPQ